MRPWLRREHEQAGAEHRPQQQRHVERTETAAAHRHGQRIGGQRQSQQHRAHRVEAGTVRPSVLRRSAGRWRYASTEPATPSGTLTGRSLASRTRRSARRRATGRARCPTADMVPSRPIALPVLAFGTVSPTKAMVSAIMTAAPRPCTARAAISSQSVGATPHSTEADREQDDAGQQQPAAADHVAEPPDADDQRGDGQQIGQHDPLHLLERGAERLRQRRQADIGDAGAERRQQHRQRKAGERPPDRRCQCRSVSDRCVASCND